jgi:hypothetical protein
MQNWSTKAGFIFSAGLAVAGLFLMTGCADDLYAPCQLDPNSRVEAVAECGTNEGSIDRSCAVDNQTQCDTGSCGRYQGSDPFCTKTCSSDSDCPSGTCVELVFQSGRRYCVDDAML